MKKKDHVVIPNSILKRFRGEDVKISVLDFNTFSIYEKATDKIFVEKNYYSEYVDNFIRDNVETQIGNIYTKVVNGNSLFIEDYQYMMVIFIIQYFRNNKYSNIINKNTLIGLIGDKKNNKKVFHNIILDGIIQYLLTGYCYNDEIKKYYEMLMATYSLFKPGILLLNNTSRSLVLPASQFVYIMFPDKEEKYYIYPVSPKVAFIWKYVGLDKCDDEVIISINDDESVEILNKLIIEQELKINVDNLVFGGKDEIKKIQKLFQK